MDITPRDPIETKTLGVGQRIAIAIGILATLVPGLLTAVGGLDFITAHLPLLLTGVGTFVSGGLTAYIAVHRMRADRLAKGASLVLLLIPALILSGCQNMTKQKIDAYGKIADSYYTAPNVATLWIIENANSNQVCEFTVKNFTRFEMGTPVPPKNIIPREPTFFEGLWDAVKTVGPWAFFGYAIHTGGFGNSSSTTVNNAAAAP